ncbi:MULTISPECIES: hypothetical protein [Streptomyces]|uniref:Uncharacterized protein n=1 Tax=Streptomyces pseudovenezuelae TaxID=67350 RepID=A0A101N0A8_9ACTN|nr:MULTISPECIES: hypothetical protein [Streptomyces]KUM84161.1 hypothetical protein AQI94_33090 [Streptomyces pseudovenezuelae]
MASGRSDATAGALFGTVRQAPEPTLSAAGAAIGLIAVARPGRCARSAGDLASLALEGIGVTIAPRPAADAITPDDHADCVLRLDDPQALQPLALAQEG